MKPILQRLATMGHAPVWKLLFRFSGPTILSMVVAAGYTVVDAIFIGRLGPEALGALPVVLPPILMVMAVSMSTPTATWAPWSPDRPKKTALSSASPTLAEQCIDNTPTFGMK